MADNNQPTESPLVVIDRTIQYVGETTKILCGVVLHKPTKRVFGAFTTKRWALYRKPVEFGIDEIHLRDEDYPKLPDVEFVYRSHSQIPPNQPKTWNAVFKFMSSQNILDEQAGERVKSYIWSESMSMKIRGIYPRMVNDNPQVFPRLPVGEIYLLAVCELDNQHYGALYDPLSGKGYVETIDWNAGDDTFKAVSRPVINDAEWTLIHHFFNKNLVWDGRNIERARNWFSPRRKLPGQGPGQTTELLHPAVIEGFQEAHKHRIKRLPPSKPS